MKRLILDFIRRWRVGYGVAALFALVFMAQSFFGTAQSHAIYPVAVYFGAFLLSFDFMRGSTRVFAALPLSAREIGRAWWHLGVTLPVLLAAFIRMAMELTMWISQPAHPIEWTRFLISSLWDFVYAGTAYFLLTFQPIALKGAVAGSRNLIGGIWGAAWGLSFGGVALVAHALPGHWSQFNPWTALGMAAGGCLTMAAYFQADRAAVTRMAFRPLASINGSPKHAAPQFSPGKSLVGIPHLIWTFSSGLAVGCGLFFILMALIDTLIRQMPARLFWERLGSGAEAGQNSSYWFCAAFLIWGVNSRTLSALRHLRTLPLTTRQFQLVWLLPTLIGSVAAWLVPILFSLAISGRGPDAFYFGWLSIFASICSLGQACLLRTGAKGAFGIFAMGPGAVAAAHAMLEWGVVSAGRGLMPMLFSMMIAILLASFWMIRRSLTQDSSAYRPRELPMGMGWQATR